MNLLPTAWIDVDPHELRLLLDEHIGGPGQYDSELGNPNKLYLPLARPECEIALTFRGKRVSSIEPGQAFAADKWQRVVQKIDRSLFDGSVQVGRDYSFISHRVSGSWRGDRSGVQILPPPENAPQ